MTRRVFGLTLAVVLCWLVACAAPMPTRVPLPTRLPPQDAAHRALSDLLSELEYDLAQARATMRFLAQAPQIRSGSQSECNAFVSVQLQNHPQFAQLGAASPNGVLYCNSNKTRRAASIADRLYYSRVLAANDMVVGEYVIGRVTLTPSLGLAYPIQDDSRALRAIIIAPLRVGWLAEQISEINIPVTGEIVVTDTYGNLLVRDPDSNDWQGKNISETPLGKAMLSQIHGSGDFAGADGETRYYEFASPQGSNNNLLVAVGIKK